MQESQLSKNCESIEELAKDGPIAHEEWVTFTIQSDDHEKPLDAAK